MTQITKAITLDVARKNFLQALVAKQGDSNSRFLKVMLANDGVTLQVPSTATAIVNAKRSDRESAGFMCTINEDGTVTVPLMNWMLSNNGVVQCSLSIFDGGEQKLSTTSFQIEVESLEYTGDDIDEDENYNILVRLISDVTELKEECIEATQEAREISDYYGSPLTASTVEEMIRTNRVYVYTGSEIGYINGGWYYYDGQEWTLGGIYNSSITETTLTLCTSAWVGESAPYQYTLTVPGMTPLKKIFVSPDPSLDTTARAEMRKAIITCTEQSDNTLRFVADGVKPTRDLTILMREVGV